LGTKEIVPGLMSDVHFLPYPYAFRNPFGIKGDEGEDAVMTYIEHMLSDVESGISQPACVVIEIVQGEGGGNAISDSALRRLRAVTEAKNIPLVVDEVQTGFCRTGTFFAFERSGIVPDVVCLSKAVGGQMPLAMIAFKEELNVWSPGAHTGTFRGNTMSFVGGVRTIQLMRELKLDHQAARKGEYLQGLLRDTQTRHACIGDVRGRGLMIGVEFVDVHKPKDGTGTFPPHGLLSKRVQQECFKRGLILEVGGRGGSVNRFLPPLIISHSELDTVATIFEDAVRAASKEALAS